jgi:hypothetical protein
MTWDVYAVRAQGARTVEELPEGYAGPDIGDPEDVLRTVRRLAPHVDATDPRWLRIEGPDHQIEIALGKDIRVHDVTFYIGLGRGDGAVPLVLEVCQSLGITPFDTETGGLLTASSRPPADAPADEEDDEDERPWWRRVLRR